MKYHIEERDAIRFVGVKYYIPAVAKGLVESVGEDTVPSFWRNLPKDVFEKLDGLSDCIPESVVGIFGQKHFDGKEYQGFEYWIAAATTKPCPEGFEEVEIPPAKWLVFEGKGPMPGSIQSVYGNVYGQFFPNSKKYGRNWEVFEVEEFTKGDPASEDYISHAWVPIVEK